MSKTYYEKVGKRYKPIAQHDKLFNSFPYGTHLVICRPNSTSYRYNVDTLIAPMIAAGMYAEDAMARAIGEKMATVNLQRKPITKEQHKLWKKLEESFMEKDLPLYMPASIESARAGISALEQEVEKMLTNPAVKSAYDQFMLVWKLTKEQEDKKHDE